MQRVATTLLASLMFLAAACGPPALMKTGNLKVAVMLDSPGLAFNVRYIKAGARWTNVWVDLAAAAKGQDVQFDPNDFELFDVASHVSYKTTQRSFISAAGMWGPMIGGGRADGWGVGIAAASQPTLVRAGTTVLLTLVFETPQDGARDITAADLVYRGQHFPIRNH